MPLNMIHITFLVFIAVLVKTIMNSFMFCYYDFAVPVLSIFGLLYSPAMRAIMSQLVGPREQGTTKKQMHTVLQLLCGKSLFPRWVE